MKFRDYNKWDNWSSVQGVSAKSNNITFDIKKYGDGFYILIGDKISDVNFNTLWAGIIIEDMDTAKDFCEKVAVYYKVKRLREGRGNTGSEMANSRLNDFLVDVWIADNNCIL